MPIMLVKVNTNDVPDSPDRWLAGEIVQTFPDNHGFGTKETPSAGNFYHIAITDKTLEEVYVYLQNWDHNPTTTQVSNQGNDRLLEVASDMVSATGKNAFTQAGVDALITRLNTDYPTSDTSYDSHTSATFRINVTVPIANRAALIEIINEEVVKKEFVIESIQNKYQFIGSGVFIFRFLRS